MEDFNWQQLGNCFEFGVSGPEDDFWFDEYERSDAVKASTDKGCMTCPVNPYCFEYGVRTNRDGVWGGVFLVNGNVIKSRNSHKTEEEWARLEELHSQF